MNIMTKKREKKPLGVHLPLTRFEQRQLRVESERVCERVCKREGETHVLVRLSKKAKEVGSERGRKRKRETEKK